ncbi:unnamed protein product, partial [Allacma fusca]
LADTPLTWADLIGPTVEIWKHMAKKMVCYE